MLTTVTWTVLIIVAIVALWGASIFHRLGFTRQGYNDQVLDFNSVLTQFPDLIVAR